MRVLESHYLTIALSTAFSPISQLSAKFLAISQPTVDLNKSQLIFFLQFYSLFFFLLKNIRRLHQLIGSLRSTTRR